MSNAALTAAPPETILVPMITLSDAIDLFDGDLARRGRSDKTRKNYREILWKLEDRFPRHWDITKITEDDCNAFLDLWAHRTLGTQGQVYAAANGLFRFLRRTRRIRSDPMEFIDPPRRQRPEDLPVITVSSLDVPLMLGEARPGTELNCIAILAFLGPRRHAVALLRRRDYDQRIGELRFREKGRKEIWKPVPDQLRLILDESIRRGDLERPAFGSAGATAYLVPPQGWLTRNERDDRIIWRIVKDVAARVGVEAHAHALRGAFACFYLENNPGDLYGLQELLGHQSLETTRIYLRRFDRRLAMAPVRSLEWLSPDTPHRGAMRLDGDAEPPAGFPAAGEEAQPQGTQGAGADATASQPAPRVRTPGGFRRTSGRRNTPTDDPDSYVYFIAAGDPEMPDGTPVKIGWAGDVLMRLRALQHSHHERLIVVGVKPGSPRTEADLHKHFASIRLRGEWFAACDELRAYVAALDTEHLPIGMQSATEVLAVSTGVGAGGFEPPLSEQPPGDGAPQPKPADDLEAELMDELERSIRELEESGV